MRINELDSGISVNRFLLSIPANIRRRYCVRDNCGPAALDMKYWAKKHGVNLQRKHGYFVADSVVFDKNDFTPEMKQQFKASGLNFNNPDDRKTFIQQSEFKNEWKKIPHYWLVDEKGKIYDPVGYNQFIKTGLATDLNSARYLQKL